MLKAMLMALIVVEAARAQPPNAPSTPKAHTTRDTAWTQQRGTDSLPLSIKLLNTGKSQRESGRDSARIAEDKEDREKAFWLTVVLALATVIQAIALFITIGTLRSTAQRQLRAYISAAIAKHTFEISGTTIKCFFEIAIWNHGQTPAHEVTGDSAMAVLPFPLPANLDFPPYPAMEPSSVLTVGAQQKLPYEFRIELTFSPEVFATIRSATSNRLYFFGEVTYLDVFKRRRKTRFCLSAHDWSNIGQQLLWRAESQHNDTT